MNKKMTRRKFAQMAAATAVAAPVLSAPAVVQQPAAQGAGDAKPKYGMSKEQEERVKQSVERGERGRGPLRSYALAYSAEPSFVFKARVKSK